MVTLGVCGLGWTGSGAVKDLLSEYEEIENITGVDQDFEFSYVYRPDGILDLKYHLFAGTIREMSSMTAIGRYEDIVNEACGYRSRIQKITNGEFLPLSKNFISEISQLSWNYFCLSDYTCGGKLHQFRGRVLYKIQREMNKRTKRFHLVFPAKKVSFSIKPDNFDSSAKKYVMAVVQSMKKSSKEIVMLDQPFSGDCPQNCFPYFENPCAIVVDRDPRDLFLLMKHVCFSQGALLDDVNDFIVFYRNIRNNISYGSDERVLRINFEDLVYEYEKTKGIVEDFLHINKQVHKNKYFNPSISVGNTQLINRFPEEKENIKIIERELSDWLYPFEKYEIHQSTGHCF